MGLIMSRFGPQGPMEDFRAGTFRLAVHTLAVFRGDAANPPAAPITLPALTNASGTTANKYAHHILHMLFDSRLVF
jgi:hypothetical protein